MVVLMHRYVFVYIEGHSPKNLFGGVWISFWFFHLFWSYVFAFLGFYHRVRFILDLNPKIPPKYAHVYIVIYVVQPCSRSWITVTSFNWSNKCSYWIFSLCFSKTLCQHYLDFYWSTWWSYAGAVWSTSWVSCLCGQKFFFLEMVLPRLSALDHSEVLVRRNSSFLCFVMCCYTLHYASGLFVHLLVKSRSLKLFFSLKNVFYRVHGTLVYPKLA